MTAKVKMEREMQEDHRCRMGLKELANQYDLDSDLEQVHDILLHCMYVHMCMCVKMCSV